MVDDQNRFPQDFAALPGEGDGHQVETALDGAEALEKFRAADRGGEGFELVITDKAMPGMNGEQLAAGIKAQTPADSGDPADGLHGCRG